MDSTLFILLCCIVVLLLFAAFMVLFASRMFRSEDKAAKAKKAEKAKGQTCVKCLYQDKGRCYYFRENDIDVNRPACIHWEEREEYRPA